MQKLVDLKFGDCLYNNLSSRYEIGFTVFWTYVFSTYRLLDSYAMPRPS